MQGVTQALARDGYAARRLRSRGSTRTCRSAAGSRRARRSRSPCCAALREAFGLAIDDVRLALLGQRAENDFVGAPVGVMDQMAASLADERTALFLDTRTLRYEQVPLPAGGASWW